MVDTGHTPVKTLRNVQEHHFHFCLVETEILISPFSLEEVYPQQPVFSQTQDLSPVFIRALCISKCERHISNISIYETPQIEETFRLNLGFSSYLPLHLYRQHR